MNPRQMLIRFTTTSRTTSRIPFTYSSTCWMKTNKTLFKIKNAQVIITKILHTTGSTASPPWKESAFIPITSNSTLTKSRRGPIISRSLENRPRF